MQSHELKIEISKDGKVILQTSGAKGKTCLDYAKLLEQIVGLIQKQELTTEFYEPDPRVSIDPHLRLRQER